MAASCWVTSPYRTTARTCAAATCTAKLSDLYVLPEFRRRGVARALMDAVRSWADAHGLRYVFWYAGQQSASPVYQAMGFSPEGSGQESYDYFEIDLSEPATRTPNPERGS